MYRLSSLCSTYSTLVMVPLSSRPSSFDHLVGAGEQRWRNFEAEHSRGLGVDDQLQLGRLQHRRVSGLGALEDAAGIDAGLAIHIGEACAVAHQSASVDIFTH